MTKFDTGPQGAVRLADIKLQDTQMQKIADTETHSEDIQGGNIAELIELFPQINVEGKIDFDVLRQLLGEHLDDQEEKFGLNWHGKRRARQSALTPSSGTLRPSPAESVNWDSTENLVIEGDNLEVLKLLQKSYHGRIKVIFIDPPYNTGNDFIYPDDYTESLSTYLQYTGQADAEGRKFSTNTEASGRFHSKWLSMMYPRLFLARNLLSADGVIFISIDDNEVDNLKKLGNEIFGEECFLAQVCWQKKPAPANDKIDFAATHDFILVYAKQRPVAATGKGLPLLNKLDRTEDQNKLYKNPDKDPRGEWTSGDYTCNKSADQRPNLYYPIIHPKTGQEVWPNRSSVWRFSQEKHNQNVEENRLWWGLNQENNFPRYKRYLSEVSGIIADTWWEYEDVGTNDEAKKEIRSLFPEAGDLFETPKPTRLIRKMIRLGTQAKSNDIVLDFFAGSGSTGEAVWQSNVGDGGNRKYILVQLPEPTGRADFGTITEITKERLRRAAKKIQKENALASSDFGFRVLKLDSSNIRAWEGSHDNVAQSLFDAIEHIKTDRSEADILHELLLKLGLELTVAVDSKKIDKHTIYSLGSGVLFVCLTPRITGEDVERLGLGIVEWRKELAPVGDSSCVFRDSAFPDDVAKTNLTAILQQYGIENVRSL